jgi:YebC/PmpR family DNA-binding regulatory protein
VLFRSSEVVYEGYAPNGIALMVETTTDNPTRTVANVRHVFSKYGGSLGANGEVDYMFTRRGQFKVKAQDQDLEELQLELIDHGLEEIEIEEDELVLYCAFADYGSMQSALEDKGLEVVEAELIRTPSHSKKLDDTQAEEVITLIDKMEDEDDVVNVFHNMDMSE